MNFDFATFLDEMAAFIAARAVLVFEPSPATQPRALWVCDVDPNYCTDPHTRLTLYGGSRERLPAHDLSIQFMTEGSEPAAALAQAQAIYDCFAATDGTELRGLDLDHFRVNSASARPLTPISRADGSEPHRWAFNVDLNAVQTA